MDYGGRIMSSWDITFCNRDCANTECERNKTNAPEGVDLLWIGDFMDCTEYIENNKEEE